MQLFRFNINYIKRFFIIKSFVHLLTEKNDKNIFYF